MWAPPGGRSTSSPGMSTVEHASRLAAGWVSEADPPPWRELQGTAVLADLTGFTTLAERFARAGPEGSELLHRVVNACFGVVLEAPLALGGDVLGFAGDAVLVWFPGDDGDDHVERAASAATLMTRHLAGIPASMTGGRRLGISIGVHTGSFHAFLVGTSRRAVLWCGPEMSRLVQLESAAGTGQVLAGPEVAERLPPTWVGPTAGPGLLLRRPSGRHAGPAPERSDLPPDPARTRTVLRSLVSPGVFDLIESGAATSDHRIASIGFVRVGGLDALLDGSGPAAVHERLDGIVDLVDRATAEVGVDWLDVDVASDGVRLMLAGGVPRTVDDDEGRLLAALRRIVGASEVDVAAGAQRGRVFAAMLGAPTRLAYTVLGDAVNVAARVAGLAAPGELLVADGIARGAGTATELVPHGEIAVKNRIEAVAVWQVVGGEGRSVQPRARTGALAERIRAAELERILARWGTARSGGGGGVVAVVGEPGMGASDLLAGLARHAPDRSVVLVADPARRQVPYSGVAALVDRLLGEPDQVDAGGPVPDRWSRLVAAAAPRSAWVDAWLPEVMALVRTGDPGASTDPLTRARRARAVLGSLLDAVVPGSWIIAVDDGHELDESSLQVLADLAERSAERGCLVVVSRSNDAARLHAREEVIELGPLSPDQAAELVAELAPRLRDDEVDRIVLAAGGNPFVLSELARHPAGEELPDSVHRLGAMLIDALSPPVRQLVREASVIGRVVPRELAAVVLGRPELAASHAWDAAASVLRCKGDSAVEFRHEVYRTVAYEMLPFERRRELHGVLADLLLEVGGEEQQLALHLERAGRTTMALPVAERAGRRAKEMGALAEAAELLGRAVAMAAEVDRSRMVDLLLEEAETRRWLGDLDGAERCLARVGRAAGDPLHVARGCHMTADVALHRGRLRVARSAAERGLAAISGLGAEAVELRCRLTLDLAARLDQMNRHTESIAVAESALELALEHGDELLEGLAHVHLEMSHSALLDPRAIEHGERAVAIFEALGHDRFLDTALVNSGLTAMFLGRWDEAEARYRRAIECSERGGQRLATAWSLLNLGFLMYRRRRLDEADALALRAMRLFDTAGVANEMAMSRLLRSMVAVAEGRLDDAGALLDAARAGYAELGDAGMLADCDVVRMSLHLAAGRHAEALALGRDVGTRLRSVEPEVVVTHGRLLGLVEELTGGAGPGRGTAMPSGPSANTGAGRIRSALDRARGASMLYEVHECLAALVDLADRGITEVTPAERSELAEIATTLGIER